VIKNFVRRSSDCGRGEFHERGATKQNNKTKKVHTQTRMTTAQVGRGEASPKGGKGKGKFYCYCVLVLDPPDRGGDPDPRLRFGTSPAPPNGCIAVQLRCPMSPTHPLARPPALPDKARIPTSRLQRTAPSVFGLIIVNSACLGTENGFS